MSDPVQAAYADAAAIADQIGTDWGKDIQTVAKVIREAILARAAEVAAAPAMGGDVGELVQRLRSGSHNSEIVTLGGVEHDARCLTASYALTAATERAKRAEARAERLRAYLDTLGEGE